MRLRSGYPYWLDASAVPGQYVPLANDVRCDVLVLGAGITGAMVACRLIQEGVSTILLDRREVGRGSTAASTGLLLYEIDTPLVELIGRVGEAAAVRAYRRGLEAIDELEQLTADLHDSCDFARRDCLYFASSAEDARGLRDEYECRAAHGFDVHYLSRTALAAISSIQAPAAIRSRGDAQVDPYRFTRQLVAAAVRDGLRVYTETEVIDIQEGEHGILVRTANGSIRAGHIVYATGYDSQHLLSDWDGALHSTYVLASEPESVPASWPDGCLIWETARPYFYARQTSDGRILMGGADTPFHDDHERDRLIERQGEQLLVRYHELFPGAVFTAEYAWAGTFAETKDGLAYIGTPPGRPRAYLALGYGGNGLTFGVIAARLIADLYVGRPNVDAAVFRFGR
jgi:glycine/D-amino acid oxidase-like deaminating enzyme